MVGQPLPASAAFVVSAGFDPTGRMLVTGGSDGSVRLFDVDSQRRWGTSLPGVGGQWATAAFGLDGRLRARAFRERPRWIWDISAERLREQACRTANRA